ncbi:hypothetical protein [Pseudorhodoferax sp. Leaf267]|uniref:hypothetical protein n=1 Tax=Pseudorhodoferax sp. Leaf267 TaxID=1736316 RepID=UPI0006F893D1|nr:hypothetical protein [Pseudorhodoferax sp. Leaf267]KQP12796.1 hypothetical protein ASF43_21540 [Pseudorhodoferax sp. Leaf267]
MTDAELRQASQVLRWICERLDAMPEHRREALQAQAFCHLANMVVLELVEHLDNGSEPYEALCSTALGGLRFDGFTRQELAWLLLQE